LYYNYQLLISSSKLISTASVYLIYRCVCVILDHTADVYERECFACKTTAGVPRRPKARKISFPD